MLQHLVDDEDNKHDTANSSNVSEIAQSTSRSYSKFSQQQEHGTRLSHGSFGAVSSGAQCSISDQQPLIAVRWSGSATHASLPVTRADATMQTADARDHVDDSVASAASVSNIDGIEGVCCASNRALRITRGGGCTQLLQHYTAGI